MGSISKITALGGGVYAATLEFGGKSYVKKYAVRTLYGSRVVVLVESSLDAPVADSAMQEEILAFDEAHSSEAFEALAEPFGPGASFGLREYQRQAVQKYGEEHAQTEMLDLVERIYQALGRANQEGIYRAFYSAEELAVVDEILADEHLI